jgi:hypothetical protein
LPQSMMIHCHNPWWSSRASQDTDIFFAMVLQVVCTVRVLV